MKFSSALARKRPAEPGGMRCAWDDLEDVVEKWERKLASENLAVIAVGPNDQTKYRAPGRKDIQSLESMTNGVGPKVSAAWTDVSARQSVWELAATVDKLCAAFYRYPFTSAKNRRICKLLSEGATWQVIARRIHCSKRRVSRVSRAVMAWRDPDAVEP